MTSVASQKVRGIQRREQPNPLGQCLTVCSPSAEHIQTKSPKCFRCLDTICSVRACLGRVSARICHMLPRTHVSPTGGEGRGDLSSPGPPEGTDPGGVCDNQSEHRQRAAITLLAGLADQKMTGNKSHDSHKIRQPGGINGFLI